MRRIHALRGLLIALAYFGFDQKWTEAQTQNQCDQFCGQCYAMLKVYCSESTPYCDCDQGHCWGTDPYCTMT